MKQEPDQAVNQDSIMQRKGILFALALLAFALTLSACTSTAPAAPTPAAENPQTPLPTATPAPTLTPTIRIKPSVTPTQVYPAASHVQHACLEEAEKQIPNELPGSLIVYYDVPPVLTPTPGPFKRTGTVNWLDLRTGQMREISINEDGNQISAPEISPDGSLLAYRTGSPADGDWLVIESNTGEVLEKIQWKDAWKDAYLQRWVNNQQLILEVVVKGEYPHYPLFVFNPFTGEQRLFAARNDIWDLCNLCPDWDGQSLTVYDPTLQYVIYPLLNREEDTIILREIDSNEIITRLPINNLNTPPKWAMNGQYFIDAMPTWVSNHNPMQVELYRFYIDGRIEQLTHLSRAFPNIFILSLSLSPDQRHIAFIYEEEGDEHSYLAVYDDETQTVRDLCFDEGEISLWDAPVWSPDSRYLALEVYIDDSRTKLVIADLQAETFVDYMDYVSLYGWMR